MALLFESSGTVVATNDNNQHNASDTVNKEHLLLPVGVVGLSDRQRPERLSLRGHLRLEVRISGVDVSHFCFVFLSLIN